MPAASPTSNVGRHRQHGAGCGEVVLLVSGKFGARQAHTAPLQLSAMNGIVDEAAADGQVLPK